MSKEKRIEIIKDALKHLPKTNTTTYNYLKGLCKISNPKEEIDKIRENCEVCMLGDLFLSTVGLYNGVDRDDIFDNYDYINSNIISDTVHNVLSKYFDEYQLNLIEVAYEGSDVNQYFQNLDGVDGEWDIENPDYINAVEFFLQHYCDELRMKAILNNMLENDGEFIP